MLPRGGTNVSSWCQLAEEGSKQPIFHFCQNAVFPFLWQLQSIFCCCCFFSLKARAQILNYLSWNSGSICLCWPFGLNKLLGPHGGRPPPVGSISSSAKWEQENRTSLRAVRRTKWSRSPISGTQVCRQRLGTWLNFPTIVAIISSHYGKELFLKAPFRL